jgi:NAD(P)-dependent dehydrogenase (short-subunit alcohol dehydrogenase family)
MIEQKMNRQRNRGAIDTPMVRNLPEEVTGLTEKVKSATPMRRMGEAEEIAKLVSWLLSDDSSYTTGAVHVVDGGSTV